MSKENLKPYEFLILREVFDLRNPSDRVKALQKAEQLQEESMRFLNHSRRYNRMCLNLVNRVKKEIAARKEVCHE